MLRVTTIKAGPDKLAQVTEYYEAQTRTATQEGRPRRGPLDYYLDENEPPGRWWGRGAEAIGLAGEVKAGQLARMLVARHPVTGARAGRGFGERSARAFDATFSAPKSASVIWALSPDPWVRAEVAAAHDAAVSAALGWFETHGAVSRRGRNGIDQVATAGLTAALFRQHTSRAGDPQLHTHAIVWSKVQDRTGAWLALDARFLKFQQRSIGWVYQAAIRSELTTRLGVSWERLPDSEMAEITGVPAASGSCSPSARPRSRSASPTMCGAGWRPMTVPSPVPASSTGSSVWPPSTAGRTRGLPRDRRFSGPSGRDGSGTPASIPSAFPLPSRFRPGTPESIPSAFPFPSRRGPGRPDGIPRRSCPGPWRA